MTQTATRKQSTGKPLEAWHQPWLALGLLVLGVGAAIVALLGPLIAEIIAYHASDGAVNQIVGGDVAGLILVAPLSILAGVLVWRRHPAGAVLGMAPAAYALYMYSQLALGGDVLRYPGNSDRFFPLFVGLFILAGSILISAWHAVAGHELPATPKWVDRSIAAFLLIVAFFLTVGLHLPGLADAWAEQPTSTEYVADPVIFWLVKFMDLAIVVPALVLTGIGILRDRVWVRTAKYAVVGWAALLGASVAGMAIVMEASGDQAASTANTIAFSLFALIAVGLAAVLYGSLFAGWAAKLDQTTKKG
ncbi:MAG: hypothetical protein WBM90_13810 [Acidimicrobiia bacterium]